MNKSNIVILGATACGKTALAVALAKKLDAEIISADSRQVYKRLDIGSGKDLAEYENVPYHLINVVEPTKKYHIFQFQKDVELALENLKHKNKRAILCGGSGMYLDAILNNYQFTQIPINEKIREHFKNHTLEEIQDYFHSLAPTVFNKIADLSSIKKAIRAIEINRFLSNNIIEFNAKENNKFEVFGIQITAEQRWKNIEIRLKNRFEEGMINEVENLLKDGVSTSQLIYFGLEYKFITSYLLGEINSFEELFEKLNTAIRQFSKRQETYFRKMEKDGIKINWIPFEWTLGQKTNYILSHLENNS
jgi:tRNA dimethylallyltransferase